MTVSIQPFAAQLTLASIQIFAYTAANLQTMFAIIISNVRLAAVMRGPTSVLATRFATNSVRETQTAQQLAIAVETECVLMQ